MRSPLKLAWAQLTRERARFAVAVCGVAFAVILMLMQLGFRRALFASAVRLHQALDADVFLIDPRTSFLTEMQSFPRRRVAQALADPEVASATAVYARLAPWRNLRTGHAKNVYVVGIDPSARAFRLPLVNAQRERLRRADEAIFDAASRPEYGPVAEELRRGESPDIEVSGRRVHVTGLFELGTSFGVDGTLLTSDLNFLRLNPERDPGLVDIGLVQLRAGASAELVRDRLRTALQRDVLVLTRAEYEAREIDYWDSVTPIGYVFGFGVVFGFAVGGMIVAQILFADVADHLDEYATLKAMGYGGSYLHAVVLYQALLLALIGYGPGLAAAAGLYQAAERATRLPLLLSAPLAGLVFALTLGMCCVSGLLALRKLRTADPAEIFR